MTAQMLLADLRLMMPELILAVGAMALLMVGVFRGKTDLPAFRLVTWLALGLLAAAAVAALVLAPGAEATAFEGAVVHDAFALYAKTAIYIAAIAALLLAKAYLEAEKLARFEFPVLIVLAVTGMSLMVSANDLITLYLGLEMQSLSLYILAAFNRDSQRASEAGLKYFVLGALSSGLLLYGASLVYGFSGATDFVSIATAVQSDPDSLGLLIGLVFVVCGLAFKISAAPFHMWTPDVYEGAPTPVAAFFATAPKLAAMALIARVLTEPFGGMIEQWQQIVIVLAILSMAVGAFGALMQSNIKRLMAYSSIGHMGFALVGLSAGTEEGVRGVVLYMTIYMIMTLGVFCCILAMRRKEEGMVEDIEDLAGLSQHQPLLAFLFSMLMFSLAGVPPLAGFFAKYFVFAAAIEAELYTLAVIGVLSSVVAAFYYLRVVKVIYFDEPAAPFEQPLANELRIVLGASSIVTLFFVAYPAPLIALAQAAAGSLMP